MESNQVMVSVCCLVYNHEKYLRQCLDGFIMQKTNFKFEVLIHDDASTDHSADIIREYERKYPDIIKPIYQTENQYSKGVPISMTYQYPRAKGRYVAFCEGDDCWTSPYKLQRQYQYMEQHPNVGLCVHEAVSCNALNNSYAFVTREKSERDYSVNEVILGGGGIFATNSSFFRRENLQRMPSCFNMSGMGDFQLFVYNTICGGCHYFPDVMSLYNSHVSGSFTDRHSSNLAMRIEFCKAKLDMLAKVDEFYDFKYTEAISKNASVTKAYLDEYLAQAENEGDFTSQVVITGNISKAQLFKNRLKKAIPVISTVKRNLDTLFAKYAISQGAKRKNGE